MKLVAKITSKVMDINVHMQIVKNSKGKDVSVAKSDEHNRHLYRVVGIASDMKTGVSNYGEWTAFLGQFQATKVETGEVFRSGKLFVPPIATNLLQGILAAGNNSAVEFAFDVGVTPDPESAVGYQWNVAPLTEVAESDPVALIMSKINAPALPAPTAAQPATGAPAATQPAANPEPEKQTETVAAENGSSKKRGAK